MYPNDHSFFQAAIAIVEGRGGEDMRRAGLSPREERKLATWRNAPDAALVISSRESRVSHTFVKIVNNVRLFFSNLVIVRFGRLPILKNPNVSNRSVLITSKICKKKTPIFMLSHASLCAKRLCLLKLLDDVNVLSHSLPSDIVLPHT
jgi:hypothetical protein